MRYLFLFLLFLIPVNSWAEEVELSITRHKPSRITIGIMNLSNRSGLDEVGHRAAEILKDDLNISGMFQVIDLARIGIPTESQEPPDKSIIKKAGKRGLTFFVWGKIFWKSGSFALEGHIYDTANGELISGKRYLGEVRILRKMVHRFADEIVYRYTGEEGIAQTQILYISEFDGQAELYMMDYDGYNPVRITGDRSIKVSPTWFPDGRIVTYTSYRDGNPDIFNLDINTGRRWKLISFSGLNISPAWSPDGNLLAFSTSRDGNSEIYVSDKDGSRYKRLTFNSLSDISPAWSPSGREMVFVSDRGGTPQLYIMDKEGLNLRRLTFKGAYNTTPKWSPDGEMIAYSCKRSGRNKLCVVSPDKSFERQITFGAGNDESPTWAPNSRLIAFSSTRNSGRHLFMVSREGSNLKQLTKGNSYYPAWSPVSVD